MDGCGCWEAESTELDNEDKGRGNESRGHLASSLDK